MKILIITNHYPYGSYNDYIFVKQLVDQWVIDGNECTVISPQSITYNLKNNRESKKYLFYNFVDNKFSYPLYSPKFITFSNIPLLKKIASILYKRAVIKTIKKNQINFDFIYSHFLSDAGSAAYECHKKFKKPFFIAFGESTFKFQNDYTQRELVNIFNAGDGYIAVSKEIKERLLSLPMYLRPESITVHPNGFNPQKFYKKNKLKVRKSLGLSESDFIVIFVGSFTHRKGLKRLNDALVQLNIKEIKAIFIGEGPEEVTYPYTLHKGKVLHSEINNYLNASDVFVLPTLNEGSCNAIIEAKATGLPIVSSNKKFNDDILNDLNSIRVNTLNIDEIKEAILLLFHNRKLRDSMGMEALKSSEEFKLNNRANNILKFIKKSSIEGYKCL